MRAIIKTREALDDLFEIWAYIAENNPVAADGVLDRIDVACQRLAQFPLSGRDRGELAAGLRSLTEGNFLILYRVTETSIQLVRVLHGARDIDAMFE